MKIGDTVRFIDPVSKVVREGALTALNETTLVAHVDCTCCGDKVVSLRDTSLDLVKSAETAGKGIDTAALYTTPYADLGGMRKPKPAAAAAATAEAERPAKAKSTKRPMQTAIQCQDCQQEFVRTSCVQKRCPDCQEKHKRAYQKAYKRKTARPVRRGDNHSAEHMRQMRADQLKAPVTCPDCQREFVRSAPSQVRCPPCQGRRLKEQQSAWYQRKKAGLAAAAGKNGSDGSDGSTGTKVTKAMPVPASALAPPATEALRELAPPVASPVPMVAHWRAWAVRYRKAAALAEELADLIGGSA